MNTRKFFEMVLEHQASLRSYIRALGVAAHHVDDMSQEVFLVAHNRRESFIEGKDLGRWLRGIARHLVANETRKNARQKRILSTKLRDFFLQRVSQQRPDEAVEHGELIETLRGCLGMLTDKSRQLLEDRYTEGLSAIHISQRMNTSPDTVRQSLYRIRNNLRKCLIAQVGDVWI